VEYVFERLAGARPYIELINALSSVLGVITWLIAIPFLIFAWRRAKEIRISIFGIEATFQQSVEAAAAIGAATAQKASSDGRTAPELRSGDLARTVNAAVVGLNGRSVLWVDDNPGNNRFEARALEALGMQVSAARDTDEALAELARGRFDIVISDMYRPSGREAGYVLLHRIKESRPDIPVIFYVGSSSKPRQEEAGKRGAAALTSDPRELVQQVTLALQRSRMADAR
jgi:CheY-like chemotaxis protein